MSEELSSPDSKCLTLVSVRYKHGEDAEKIRKRVRKKLSKALHPQPQQKGAKHVKRLPQLNTNDLQQMATSSRHVVVLLNDGRVARFKMSPTHEPGPHSGTAKPRQNARASLQVLSDEQYARRLQSMADQDGIDSPIYSPPPPYMPSDSSPIYWPHLDSPHHPFDISFGDFRDPTVNGIELDFPLLPHLPPGAEDEFEPRLSNLWSQFGLSTNEPRDVEDEGQPQYERLDSGVSLDTGDAGDQQKEGSAVASHVVPKNSEKKPQLSSSSLPSTRGKRPEGSTDRLVPGLVQEISSILTAAIDPQEGLVGERRERAPDGRGREVPSNHSRAGNAGSSSTAIPAAYDAHAPSASSKASKAGGPHPHLPHLGPIEWLTSVEVEGGNLGEAPPFQLVSATHSEALLVAKDTGVLYQWLSDHDSARPYPLTDQFKLVHGGIRLLKSSDIRTTLVLDTGEIATFYDPLLRDSSSPQPPQLIAELTHPAQLFPGLRPPQDKIESLAVGDFLSMAITTSGKTYWWGLLPQSDTSGSVSAASFSDHPSSDMTVGCTVRLKDGPKYGGGALVFRHHPQYGPQIACTLDQVEQTPLDHTTMMVKVLQQRRRGAGQMGEDHDVVGGAEHEGGLVGHYLDKWEGSQVTLLEDSTPVLGKLVAIDSGQAVIDISLKDEAGPISSSSSGSMSSLKIYRVSQLQVVNPAFSSPASSSQGAEMAASPRRATPGSQGARPAIRLAACRQQAAGVVQKQPVCIINAQHDASSESLFDVSAPGASTSESLIAGFKPLTAVFIDEKPLILVERLCDKKVFLLLSSKSSGTILQPSSFIAVGTGKSQPLKCTVEEESILSTDAGFAGHSLQDILAFCPSEVDPVTKGTSVKGKESQKKAGLKRRHYESSKEEPVLVLSKDVRTPELCSNSTGSVLLLRDLAGGVYPLKHGLALSQCVSSSDRSDADGYGLGDTAFSALSIEERTLDSTTSCIIFVLVPKPDSLLEDVIAGRADKVVSAISQIQHSASSKIGQKGKERQGTLGSPSTSSAKRRKAQAVGEDGGVPFGGTAQTSEMKLPLACEPLLACTTRNRNLLHLCCEAESSTVTGQQNGASSAKEGRDAWSSSGGDPPHLVILKTLLNSSCMVINTVVKYLLCQKNSSGYNPFQWALRLQNHSAALAILDYVNQCRSTIEPDGKSPPSISTTSSLPSSLFSRAILQHSGEGMTPLQLFVQSLLPSAVSYDLCSKVMRVFNLPSGVTAQQLYELFHSYYPSVYRVEVKDGDREEGENSDSGDSSDSETEDKRKDGSGERRGAGLAGGPSSSGSANPPGFPPLPPRHPLGRAGRSRRPRTRRERRVLRGRYRVPGDPEEPLMALVYFSDVQHLRSAASQMQNHRLSVSRNRNLAWSSGQTFRCIEVEVDAYQDPDSNLPGSTDGSGLFGLLGWGRLHGHRPSKLSSHVVDEGSKARSNTATFCGEASMNLLKKLLEDVEIATLIDAAGETAVSSLLHNRAALQTLLTPSNSKEVHSERKDKQRTIPLPSAFQSGRDQLQREAMNRTLLTQARDVHRQSLRHIREMEDYLHSMAQQLGLRSLPPRLTPLASRPTQAKPTALLQETTTLNPSADVSDAATASSPSLSIRIPSPQGGASRTPSKPSPLTTSVAAAPQQQTSSTDVEITDATPDMEHDDVYVHVVLDTGKDSNQSTAETNDTSIPVQAMGSSDHLEETDPISLVKQVFSSWPCIVATVLGYAPSCLHSTTPSSERGGDSEPHVASSESHMKAGHVTVLDAFLQRLLYSTHTQLINTFFTTVIEKVTCDLQQESTARYFRKEDGSYSFDKIPLEEGSVGLVVGSVLLRAVIRLLTVEYSKPLGASTTALHRFTPTESGRNEDEDDLDPPPPPSRRQQLLRNSSTQEKPQNVYPVIKSILTAFSCISLEFLASACEGVMAPVRLGLAKPLGASSVCAEYQMSSSRTTTYYGGRVLDRSSQDAASALSSSSLPRLRASSSYRAREGPLFTLPTGGIRLQPQSGITEAQNYSQDVLDNEPGDDTWPASSQGAEEGMSFSTPMTQDSGSRLQVALGLSDWGCLIDEEMLIVETSDSDSEAEAIQLQDILHAGHSGGGGGVEEESGGMVYQYAWALDGRTLGEVFRGTSSTPMELIDPYVDPKSLSVNNIPSIRFGAGFLTRTFARLVKELVDIAKDIADKQKGVHDKEKETGSKDIKIPMVRLPESVFGHMLQSSLHTLEPSWEWVVSLMDVAEGQLQRGSQFDTQHYVQALRGTSRNSSHLPHSPHAGMSAAQGSRLIGSSPAEYVTSLLRCHSGESEGTLPVLDLYGYEHVVYALDAFMYVLNRWPKDAQATICNASCAVTKEKAALGNPSLRDKHSEQEPGSSMAMDEEDHRTTLVSPPTDKSYSAFFKRSVSLFESSPPDLSLDDSSSNAPLESAFSRSVTEELPLAEHPHLLSLQAKQSSLGHTSAVGKASSSASSNRASMPVSLHAGSALPKPSLMKWSPEQAAQHWQTTISVFAHIFLVEGPGNERSNFLYTHAGVASRMARFRHQVNVLRDQASGQREFGFSNGSLSIRVRRTHLLQDGLDLLKNLTCFRYSQVRVRFEGEDGSGPGVNRGFFAAFANALKTSDKLKGGTLLHEPGKLPEQAGLFAPTSLEYGTPLGMSKKDKEERLFNFRALGRFIGLCLWFKQTVPLMISRHVAKFLLGRELTWHDLAFFNSDLYEGLRRMLLDAEEGVMSKEDFLAAYCCYFEAPLGDSMVELVPGGTKIPVSPDRVKEYVKLYAMFRMVECVKSELKSMKHGLYNVIPLELLSGITAEDFQLLLSGGSENITLSMLKTCFRFQHSHSGSKNITQRFERMFWKVVSQMTTQQKQQLLYFATGSSALPLQADGGTSFQVVIDVIGGNLESLPIASTCSQRVSIPLYPSYHILRRKLLQAIQCQSYGLA